MKVTTRAGKAYIKIVGDLSIANAAELKNIFLKSLEKADMVEINLEKATSVDLAALQLISSASLTAIDMCKRLTVKDPSVPIFEEAVLKAGFKNSNSCSFASLIDSA